MSNVVGLVQTITLTQINCGKCGGTYAINERYYTQARTEGTAWTCPYCKTGWGFTGNGDNERLKKELETEKRRVTFANDQARMERERRTAAEHRERAQKAAKTRIKNRISKGVCPCCNRTFIDLQRHMATKHADYTDPSN